MGVSLNQWTAYFQSVIKNRFKKMPPPDPAKTLDTIMALEYLDDLLSDSQAPERELIYQKLISELSGDCDLKNIWLRSPYFKSAHFNLNPLVSAMCLPNRHLFSILIAEWPDWEDSRIPTEVTLDPQGNPCYVTGETLREFFSRPPEQHAGSKINVIAPRLNPGSGMTLAYRPWHREVSALMEKQDLAHEIPLVGNLGPKPRL